MKQRFQPGQQPGGDLGARRSTRPREARKALEQGKHVFLFSDNVPLEQEVELKQLARSAAGWSWVRTAARA